MRRSRETIDAPVLASAIGIDGTVERNIRRLVAGHDFSSGVDRQGRRDLLEFLDFPGPAVIDRFKTVRFEPPGAVASRTAALSCPIWKFPIHGGRI